MDLLQEVAHIAGKSGLYRIIKPGRAGVIVESLDDKKEKQMVNSSAQVSILKDISMYTTDYEVSRPLGEIFMNIKTTHDANIDIDIKNASKTQLFGFLESVMPDFDGERIRESDVKKLITWYKILLANLPEAFVPSKAEEAPAE
jgi:Domain of unknown function (DUF5606)